MSGTLDAHFKDSGGADIRREVGVDYPLPVTLNVRGTAYVANTTQAVANTILAGSQVQQIDVLTDTVLSELTAASGYTLSGTLTGVTLPAGTSLCGRFASFTLTSGSVIASLV